MHHFLNLSPINPLIYLNIVGTERVFLYQMTKVDQKKVENSLSNEIIDKKFCKHTGNRTRLSTLEKHHSIPCKHVLDTIVSTY